MSYYKKKTVEQVRAYLEEKGEKRISDALKGKTLDNALLTQSINQFKHTLRSENWDEIFKLVRLSEETHNI